MITGELLWLTLGGGAGTCLPLTHCTGPKMGGAVCGSKLVLLEISSASLPGECPLASWRKFPPCHIGAEGTISSSSAELGTPSIIARLTLCCA